MSQIYGVHLETVALQVAGVDGERGGQRNICLNVLFFRSERTLSQSASTIYEMFFISANVFF